MLRTILIFIFTFSASHSYFTMECRMTDLISFAAGKESETRAVNLTKCDTYGSHRLIVRQPVNSSKAIRVTIISQEEATDTTWKVDVIEIATGEYGYEKYLQRKHLDGVDDSVISSPFTQLMIDITKIGDKGAKAEIIFQFTLEDGGCPYPFLESRLGSPLVISSEVLANECDFHVTAVDPGTVLELSSVNDSIPHQKHSVAVVIYDGFGARARLHRIEQSEFDADLKENLGTSQISVHVTNPTGGGKNHEVAFITINSVVDDCECPEENVILNDTHISYKFEIIKDHCLHINCTVDVQIAEAVRHLYRLKATPYYSIAATRMFSIRDGGIGEFINFKDIPSPRNFVSVHPRFLLSRTEGKKPTKDVMRAYLVRVSEEEQARCDCPMFLNTMTFTIDASCPPMDCVWSLPKFDHTSIPMLTLDSNATDADVEMLRIICIHGEMEDVTLLTDGLSSSLCNEWNEKSEEPKAILHYHRSYFYNEFELEFRKTPSYFKITFSTKFNMTEYEHACNCFNRTINVDPSTELAFSSPRYPLHYCSNLNCRTIFEAPKGYRVVFRPHVLSLQKGGDYLTVYDLIEGNEIRRERYTGTYLDGFTTESRTSKLLAVFKSDRTVNYNGFNASVYAAKMDDDFDFDNDETVTKSGGFFLKFLLILLFLGSVAVGILYRRSQRGEIRLSFAPVTFMNSGGEFDDGSVSFPFSR